MTDMARLNKLLSDVLDSYNEVNAVMNLVSRARADSVGASMALPGCVIRGKRRRGGGRGPVPWKASPREAGC